jgi:hypothetical protein
LISVRVSNGLRGTSDRRHAFHLWRGYRSHATARRESGRQRLNAYPANGRTIMTKGLIIAAALATTIAVSGCHSANGGCGSPQFNNILKSDQLRRDRNWCND